MKLLLPTSLRTKVSLLNDSKVSAKPTQACATVKNLNGVHTEDSEPIQKAICKNINQHVDGALSEESWVGIILNKTLKLSPEASVW